MPRVEIEIKDKLLDELSEAFFWAEQRSALELTGGLSGKLSVFTVARVNGLKVMIRPGEHRVPHFHVAYQGEEASYSILHCRRLEGAPRLKRREAEIRSWWHSNRERLIEVWNNSRPTDRPVGPLSSS